MSEDMKDEVIKFYYFSEGGCCGNDSTANDNKGTIQTINIKANTTTDMMPLPFLNLINEIFELLPVIVVYVFLVPIIFWFTARITIPITIMIKAMIYPYPGFKPFKVLYI